MSDVGRRVRRWFVVDGLVTGVNALAYLTLSTVLPAFLGASSAVYLWVGAVLAVVTIGLLVVGLSRRPVRGLAWLLVVVNVVWSIGSFVVAAMNPFERTVVGLVWTVAQGFVVLAFAVLQTAALRAEAAFPR